MKVSTKGRYGLRILLDLALHDSGTPRMIRDIAESQQISEKYISRLIIELRRAALVRSIRGSKGGYRIAKAPEEITLLEVLEVMEGPVSIVDCVRKPEQCCRVALCPTRDIWERVNNDIRSSMSKVTLREIIDNFQQRNSEVVDYCI